LPYIFGYGSLIEQASRLRSTPSALYVLPARARGHLEILLMGVAERRASSCEKNLIPFCLTRSFVEAGDYRSRELFTLEGA
jgi:hypothetical protein